MTPLRNGVKVLYYFNKYYRKNQKSKQFFGGFRNYFVDSSWRQLGSEFYVRRFLEKRCRDDLTLISNLFSGGIHQCGQDGMDGLKVTATKIPVECVICKTQKLTMRTEA